MISTPPAATSKYIQSLLWGFSGLHPIQAQAIGPVLENRDLIIQSATGSDKTETVLAPGEKSGP